jgi:glycosyltransferase involved in cell wall biosynthesis
VKRGAELRILAARASDNRGVHGKAPVPIETVKVPGWPSWLPKYRERREAWTANRVARLALRGPTPALIYERWSLFSHAGERIRADSGAPWVLEVNAPLLQERARFEEVRDVVYADRMQREALQSADRLVVVSDWLANWLTQDIGVLPSRIRVVPNGTSPHIGDRDKTRRELGFGDQDFVVGFLGSMKVWHGVQRLPKWVEGIQNAKGRVVGSGPVDLPEGLVQTGSVSEARSADLLAAMDVGLIPYPPEAPTWFCPLKLWAYRAQGTPVVASDVGELSTWLGEGDRLVRREQDWVAQIESCRSLRTTPYRRLWTQVLDEALDGLL